MSEGFYCKDCGKTVERRASRCPFCNAFNTLVSGSSRDGGWVRGSGGAVLVEDVEVRDVDRITTGTRELDRVLAGGFALDGAYVLSGSPGAGKSTLLLQVMNDLADAEIEKARGPEETDEPWNILIAAAEETTGQIAGRWRRLMPDKPSRRLELRLANQNDVLEIEKLVAKHEPDILVVDSIQTMTMAGLDAPAGSVTAIKACATYLSGLTKARKMCLIMVAHVTKDDELAGPKMFEHLVDGVMHLSDEDPFRVLRMSKHRFGPTNEVGIFRMGVRGLESVENPSELLLEAHLEGVPGCVVAVMSDSDKEGSARALLVEVQCLAMKKLLPGISWNVSGLDAARARAIGAVLAERMQFRLEGEVFLSIAGGVKSRDPGLDLPVALGLVSAALDQDLPEGFCAFGEVGLAGEIRPPRNVEGRVKSALAMKVSEIMGPPVSEEMLKFVEAESGGETEYTVVRSLAEALDVLEWDVAPKPVKRTRRKKK